MPIRNSFALTALLLLSALTTAAHAADTPHWVHYRLLNNSVKLPKKVVVIPASISVTGVTRRGGQGDVPDRRGAAGKKARKEGAGCGQ